MAARSCACRRPGAPGRTGRQYKFSGTRQQRVRISVTSRGLLEFTGVHAPGTACGNPRPAPPGSSQGIYPAGCRSAHAASASTCAVADAPRVSGLQGAAGCTRGALVRPRAARPFEFWGRVVAGAARNLKPQPPASWGLHACPASLVCARRYSSLGLSVTDATVVAAAAGVPARASS